MGILSEDKAEVAANKKVLVTAEDVDILGRHEVKISAVPRPINPAAAGVLIG